jgi:hypothetical protein
MERGDERMYLMSVNCEGRSTIRAPPKSGVLRKVAMLFKRLGS